MREVKFVGMGRDETGMCSKEGRTWLRGITIGFL